MNVLWDRRRVHRAPRRSYIAFGGRAVVHHRRQPRADRNRAWGYSPRPGMVTPPIDERVFDPLVCAADAPVVAAAPVADGAGLDVEAGPACWSVSKSTSDKS